MIISIYLFLFLLGLVIVLALASLGFIGDLSGGDTDVDSGDIDSGDAPEDSSHRVGGISPLSPFIISIFISSFGGIGLVLENNMNEYLVPIIAFCGGFALTAVSRFALRKIFIESQADSSVSTREILGELGEVTVPIPNDGNFGSVTIDSKSGRLVFSARADSAIRRGEIVRIKRRIGNVLDVERVDAISEENYKKESTINEKVYKTSSPQTIIYDQRKIIEIKDSVVQRTKFGNGNKDD